MTHANCGCCCDNSLPLIGPTGPTGAFFQWLNATGLLDAGPLAPQQFSGQGFETYWPSTTTTGSIGGVSRATAAAERVARAGTLEFPDFRGDVVVAGTASSAGMGVAGSNADSWRAIEMIGPPASGATITVEYGQHVASNGGARVTLPAFAGGGADPRFFVSKTLTLDGTQVPLDGVGMPSGTTVAPSMQLHRCRLADDLDLLTVTDGPNPVLPWTSTPNSAGHPRYYRLNSPTGPVSMQLGAEPLRESLLCRVVVERDGVVVADRVRPTGTQYDADTAADGSYIVTRYFGRQYDDPTKIQIWPPRPERLVTSFAKDTTPQKFGISAPNDRYYDESYASVGVGTAGVLQSRTYLYATKPYRRDLSGSSPSYADESVPGAAVRPSRLETVSSGQYGLLLSPPGQNDHTTMTLGGDVVTGSGLSTQYVDDFGQLPASLPVVPFRAFPVPSGGKGPRPVLEHPAAMVREPYRPLSQAERVSSVGLTFSEPIVVTGVNAGQVQLHVDGVSQPGCTIAAVTGSQQQFTIGVPTGPQTEGAFCILTYDPAGQVVSDTADQRPAELAARTSWMMQKPYKQDRLVAVNERTIQVGQLASLSATGPIGPGNESLKIILTAAANISRDTLGTVAHRPTQDLFAPQMPFNATGPVTAGPQDCAYYGMTTTIFPCSPTGLSCPMPRLPQPHNSAFRHGRAAGNIVVTLSGQVSPPVAAEFQRYSPLTFSPTLNGRQLPQGVWATEVELPDRVLLSESQYGDNSTNYHRRRTFRDSGKLEGTFHAIRRVTEYPALGQAYPWELEMRMTLRVQETISVETETIGNPTGPVLPITVIPNSGWTTTATGPTGNLSGILIYGPATEFHAAVTAAEELDGQVVRTAAEFGKLETPAVVYGPIGSWGAGDTFGPPFRTVQVDF